MSTARISGEDLCPLDGRPSGYAYGPCGDCIYFRGVTSLRQERVVCNWPRNGKDFDETPSKVYRVPDVFLR